MKNPKNLMMNMLHRRNLMLVLKLTAILPMKVVSIRVAWHKNLKKEN